MLHVQGEHILPVPPLAVPDLTQLSPTTETLPRYAAVAPANPAQYHRQGWFTHPGSEDDRSASDRSSGYLRNRRRHHYRDPGNG